MVLSPTLRHLTILSGLIKPTGDAQGYDRRQHGGETGHSTHPGRRRVMRTTAILPILSAVALVGAAACTSPFDKRSDDAQTASNAPAATREAQPQTVARQNGRAQV